MSEFGWSSDQEHALRRSDEWLRSTDQVLYIGGFAGTGKSTLAMHLVGGRRFLFATLTGKAAHVLRRKGCHDARTIHSLIYRPAGQSREADIRQLEAKILRLDGKRELFGLSPTEQSQLDSLRARLRQARRDSEMRFSLWENSPLADQDVEGVVIDEVSMVDAKLGKDLESFGKKILVIGDPAQLPPVGGGGYFTKRKPDVLLTEIHRHARESGVLRLATLVREGGDVGSFSSSDDCVVVRRGSRPKEELAEIAMRADQTLVGRNATRRATNHRHRELLGRSGLAPEVGDKLVCLRNYRDLGMFNGSQWWVRSADLDEEQGCGVFSLTADDDAEAEPVAAEGWLHHFLGRETELEDMGWDRMDLVEADYGFALTVHKSQGSQWDDVLVFDESAAFRGDARRWLYTAVTRAARRLTVVV